MKEKKKLDKLKLELYSELLHIPSDEWDSYEIELGAILAQCSAIQNAFKDPCPRTSECENFKPKENNYVPIVGDTVMVTNPKYNWHRQFGKEIVIEEIFGDMYISDGVHWELDANFKLIKPKPTYSGVAVHTPTKEEWDRVVKHEKDIRGKQWVSVKTQWWDWEKDGCNCLVVDKETISRENISFFRREGYEIITVAEYFRRYGPERAKPKYKIGDRVRWESKIKDVKCHEDKIVAKNEWNPKAGKYKVWFYGGGWMFEDECFIAPTPDPKMVKALRESIEKSRKRENELMDEWFVVEDETEWLESKYEELTGEKYTPIGKGGF